MRTRMVAVAPAALACVLCAAAGTAHAQARGSLASDPPATPAERGAATTTALYVVTPATPQRWIANQGAFLFVYRDPGGDSSRVSFLRRWAKDDRFDLAKRAQSAVLEAVAARGRLALPLAVSRPEQIEPSPLARDQVPETALRGEILDVSVEWFGVASSGPFSKYQPFVRLSWRVLDARGGIVEPSRVAYYNEIKGAQLPKAHGIAADPDCAWKDLEAMAKERPRVWACFNDALVKLAQHVAETVVPAPPPAS